MIHLNIVLAIGILLASTLSAASPKVGDKAPELDNFDWIANAPEFDPVAEDLKGDAYFVVFWGVS
ncbi:MAG: hypothetical protein L3J82_04550 [Planctomycetes bacterium]|nr:hypothetical protein [Planctomycetota bacterium]